MLDMIATTRRTLQASALALVCTSLASCVSRAQYDDAIAELKYYQRLYQDLESYQGKLESENAALAGELDIYQTSGTVEASAPIDDIDRRMEELERLAQGLGAAPGDVTVLTVQGGYGLRLADAVLFPSGSNEILPEGREVLNRMAQEIRSRPFERIWVRGHTDSDPVKREATLRLYPHGNLQLSTARALEVAALLTGEGGIPQQSVVVAGFGPNEPVAANDSAENKQRNRRVEIFVIEDEQEAAQER